LYTGIVEIPAVLKLASFRLAAAHLLFQLGWLILGRCCHELVIEGRRSSVSGTGGSSFLRSADRVDSRMTWGEAQGSGRSA